MRVGLLIYDSLETLSGGYLYDRKLVAHLRAHGHEVEVVSLQSSGYARHLAHNASLALARRLRGADFDVLLQDELNHPSLFLLNRWLAPRVRYPIVSIVHHLRSDEDWPLRERALYRWIERRYLESVDAFVLNSEATRRSVRRLIRRPAPDVIAHPAGDRLSPVIDEEAIRRRAREKGPLRLLFLGNLIPRKGLLELLSWLAEAGRGAWHLDVVGSPSFDADYAARVRRKVGDLGLADRVTLHGSLDDEALKDRFARSHALVVPSSYEGFGIVYLEAMGFGLPAVGTTEGGATEIITPGEDGWLVRPGQGASVVRELLALEGDRDRLIEMSLAARRRYLAHPSWEESMARIRAFLEARAAGATPSAGARRAAEKV